VKKNKSFVQTPNLRFGPKILRANPKSFRAKPESLRAKPKILRAKPQIFDFGLKSKVWGFARRLCSLARRIWFSTMDFHVVPSFWFIKKQLDDIKKTQGEWYFDVKVAQKYGLVDEIL
jgi:hypothetical protein